MIAARLLVLLALLIAPLAAEAQQQAGKVWRIGVLTLSVAFSTPTFQAFLQGLRDQGYVEGQNMTLELRFANGSPEKLGDMAAELVRMKVDVIVTESVLAAREARNATGTIPIVTAVHGDPVGAGLAASVTRPGGNVTGLSLLAPELSGKRLQLLKEVHPEGYSRGHHLERQQWCGRSLPRRESFRGSLARARHSGCRSARPFRSKHSLRRHNRRSAERLHDATRRHAPGTRAPLRRICSKSANPSAVS